MRYLVATDLDGTLLRRDYTVSDRTKAALRDAAAAGVEVVYATGRPPRWLPEVYEATGHSPITICANGALTLQDGEPLQVHAIPDETVAEVREILSGLNTDVVFFEEQWRGHTLKMLAALSAGEVDEVLAQVRTAAGHLVEPTHSAFDRLLIEMGPSGITKAFALLDLRSRLWPEHTLIAVGDMPNDAAMLQAADIAVTVQSGHPSLREIAAEVIPGPEQDGLAQLLERLAQ